MTLEEIDYDAQVKADAFDEREAEDWQTCEVVISISGPRRKVEEELVLLENHRPSFYNVEIGVEKESWV